MKNGCKLGFGFTGTHPAGETIELVKLAEDAGLDSCWIAEDYFQSGAFSLATACALNTSRIKIGIGVINPYTRHPTLAAMEAATLDELSGGRILLALGASNKKWMEFQAGIPYEKPITATKECAVIMKELLSGGEAHFTGDYFRTGAVRLHNTPLRPDLPLYLGVKGDRALEAAGEVADGVLLSAGSPLAYIAHARERIAAGARRAGRDPSKIRVAAYLPTYMDADGALARDRMRPVAARYLGLHGDKPIMTVAGISPEESAPFKEAFLKGTAPSAPVTDRMVDTLVVAGTPEECARRIEAYVQAGVDEPIVFEAAGVCPPAETIQMLKAHLL